MLCSQLIVAQDGWKVHKDDKEMVPKDYGLEQSNPNIVFALCSGCKSSPAVSKTFRN